MIAAGTWAALSFLLPDIPVIVHVRWDADVMDAERRDLERRFSLADSEQQDGATWRYRLRDRSRENIRALVLHERVDDTAYLHRTKYRPAFAMDRSRRILVFSLAAGCAASILFLVLGTGDAAARRRGAVGRAGRSLLDVLRLPPIAAVGGVRLGATAWVVAAAALGGAAMGILAGASVVSAVAALGAVYVGGYLIGALLINQMEGQFTLTWTVIRTLAGLMLATYGFLLSLVAGVPWFVGPAALLVAALLRVRGTQQWPWPPTPLRPGWDGAVAAVLAAIMLSPIVITAIYMTPGDFPPVFYNADTSYFLEKVHALKGAESYPPASLSNAGGLRTYHFGMHAMTALIANLSGLAAHHALFLIVLPLSAAGVAAAAVAVARYLAPALPYSVTVPLLLVSVPSLGAPFWGELAPRVWDAVTSFSLSGLLGPADIWGILSNEGQNVGGDFLILGSVAALAAAPSIGWRLAVFLVGSGILIKTPAGIALVAGFALAEGWQALTVTRLRPSARAIAIGAAFLVTYGLFFVLPPVAPDFRIELYPLYHLRLLIERDRLGGIAADAVWLLLPVLIVASARVRAPAPVGLSVLLLGVAPLVLVNATRMVDVRPGLGGPDEDWLQVLHLVPFMLHAFAIAYVSRRWHGLGRAHRGAALAALVLAILPVAAAARYSLLLLRHPERGHEFVDNRSLGEALKAIPTPGTMLVTNDLRYPADGFRREGRQMQIPALFGHQAFAVNYSYEVYAFSRERAELQRLLQAPEWTDAILTAARTHRWTHLLIRKDYVHPARIPLPRIFDNAEYSVFRFP